jgi:hypothetical protein
MLFQHPDTTRVLKHWHFTQAHTSCLLRNNSKFLLLFIQPLALAWHAYRAAAAGLGIAAMAELWDL